MSRKVRNRAKKRRKEARLQTRRKDGEVIKRSAVFNRQTIDEDARTVELSFSSEDPVESFFGPEVLLHEESAADFRQLADMGSVLFNHNPDAIVGRPEDVRLDKEARKGRAVVRFDEDARSEELFSKVRGGSLRGVSVGFRVGAWQILDRDQTWESPEGRAFTGPMDIAVQWEPREISLTPIPADTTVGVGRTEGASHMDERTRAILEDLGLSPEATEEQAWEFLRKLNERAASGNADGDPPEPEPEPGRASANQGPGIVVREDGTIAISGGQPAAVAAPAGVDTERERQKQIRAIARSAKVSDDVLNRWLDGGSSVESASVEAWEIMSERNAPISEPGQRIELGMDASEKYFRHAQASIELRAEMSGINLKPDDEYREDADPGMSLMDALRGCLKARGMEKLTKSDILQRSFSHSTSDFPLLLANVVNKSLTIGFTEQPSTWQPWTQVNPAADFKSINRVKVSEAENFEVVPENMPIPEGTLTEAQETYQVSTYAKKFGVSRQTIVNDDLAAITRQPQRHGAAAARTINEEVYKHLISNPTMAEDSEALFSTNHTSGSNLSATSDAISVASLGAARALMRLQKGLAGTSRLNIVPSFLLMPPSQETDGLQVLQGQFIPNAASGTPLQWMRNLTPITEAVIEDTALTGGSATAWYLIASPVGIDTLEVGFLNGVQTPSMAMIEGTDILGMAWLAWIDFGVRAIEHRSFFKNPGA